MKTHVRWTPRDLEILREHFATATASELVKLLKGRHTERGIIVRAWREGLVKSEAHLGRVGKMNVRWSEGPPLPRVAPPPEPPLRKPKPAEPEPRQRLQLRQG